MLSTCRRSLRSGASEELLHLSAAQADHVRMLLLRARLVVVLAAVPVHQIEFVDQAGVLQRLNGAVDGDAIQLGVPLERQFVQPFHVQVPAGLIDQVEQDSTLSREPESALLERFLDAIDGHEKRFSPQL